MVQPKSEVSFVQSDLASFTNVHRFPHLAMATTFEVIVQHDDALYARQAADAAFCELDRLEGELSRYVENSDISQINGLAAGKPLRIGLDAFECLQLSARICAQTNGAFDITIGHVFDCWLNPDKSPRIPSPEQLDFAARHTGVHLLKLDELQHTVELLTSPLKIDLGGVGKGYAVDRMAELLRQWSIDRALVHGGFSSVLALDGPNGAEGWPITLSEPYGRRQAIARIFLRAKALSASGLQKGRHIIDPRTPGPVEGTVAAWSWAPDAATADALSTAFMVMTVEEIKRYCSDHPGVLALVILKGDKPRSRKKVLHFGSWKEAELLV